MIGLGASTVACSVRRWSSRRVEQRRRRLELHHELVREHRGPHGPQHAIDDRDERAGGALHAEDVQWQPGVALGRRDQARVGDRPAEAPPREEADVGAVEDAALVVVEQTRRGPAAGTSGRSSERWRRSSPSATSGRRDRRAERPGCARVRSHRRRSRRRNRLPPRRGDRVRGRPRRSGRSARSRPRRRAGRPP